MKGKAIIELTNIHTGEVERFEHNNMFTNALHSIFNRAPFYMNNALLNTSPGIPTLNEDNVMVPVATHTLGGLLMFPEPLDEDPNLFYAPADNKPTGIASYDAYTGEDARRGSINILESGPIDGGYQYTWDFSTSQGNGKISSLALTNYKGGRGYLDGDSLIFHNVKVSGTASVGFSFPTYSRGSSQNNAVLGCDNDGVYFRDDAQIKRISFKNHTLDLTLRGDFESAEILMQSENYNTFCLCGDEFWLIQANKNDTIGKASEITIRKFNKKTLDMTTEVIRPVVRVAATANGNVACVRDGYLYIQGYQNLVAKINLSNIADVTEIEAYSSAKLFTVGTYVCGATFLIESDDTVHEMKVTGEYTSSNNHLIPMYLDGCWVAIGNLNNNNPTSGNPIGFSILTPILFTINNLESSIFKTADKTMKIIYRVTQE